MKNYGPIYSPLPWSIGNRDGIIASGALVVARVNQLGFPIGEGKSPVSDANAAFIVTACNAHDALVEALEPFAAFLDALELDRQGAESFYSIHNAAGSRQLTRAHFRMARAALAKVAK